VGLRARRTHQRSRASTQVKWHRVSSTASTGTSTRLRFSLLSRLTTGCTHYTTSDPAPIAVHHCSGPCMLSAVELTDSGKSVAKSKMRVCSLHVSDASRRATSCPAVLSVTPIPPPKFPNLQVRVSIAAGKQYYELMPAYRLYICARPRYPFRCGSARVPCTTFPSL
jgi:hypothetical protein